MGKVGGGMYDTRVFLGLDWIEPWGEGAGPFDETTRMNFFFFFLGGVEKQIGTQKRSLDGTKQDRPTLGFALSEKTLYRKRQRYPRAI